MPRPPISRSLLKYGPALVSAALAIALYAITLAGTYVYDDEYVTRDDPRLSEPGGWKQYLHESYFGRISSDAPLWRPIPSLSYAAQRHLFGANPFPAHLINVLLHALVCSAVAELARRLTKSSRIALIAGLLFASHPVHVEAVAGIVGRAELLCTLFIVIAMILFRRQPITPQRVAGIAGCFVAAILSKEHGLLLLLILPAMWLIFGLQSPTLDISIKRLQRKRLAILFLLLCVFTLAYTSWREHVATFEWEKYFFAWEVNPLFRARGWSRVLLPFSILGRYAGLLVAPFSLSPDYGANITDYRLHANDPYFYLGVLTLIAFIASILIAVRRQARVVIFCLAGVAIFYSLISNSFLLIGTPVAERLLYLTSAFFVILLATALAHLPARALTPLVAVLIVAGGLRTLTYAWEWNEPLRLFTRASERHPESIKLHMLLAKVLADRGRPQEAERQLAEARAIGPESAEAWRRSARLAQKLGHEEQSREFQRRAFNLEMNPLHMR